MITIRMITNIRNPNIAANAGCFVMPCAIFPMVIAAPRMHKPWMMNR
jgi:hypothetical protein